MAINRMATATTNTKPGIHTRAELFTPATPYSILLHTAMLRSVQIWPMKAIYHSRVSRGEQYCMLAFT